MSSRPSILSLQELSSSSNLSSRPHHKTLSFLILLISISTKIPAFTSSSYPPVILHIPTQLHITLLFLLFLFVNLIGLFQAESSRAANSSINFSSCVHRLLRRTLKFTESRETPLFSAYSVMPCLLSLPLHPSYHPYNPSPSASPRSTRSFPRSSLNGLPKSPLKNTETFRSIDATPMEVDSQESQLSALSNLASSSICLQVFNPEQNLELSCSYLIPSTPTEDSADCCVTSPSPLPSPVKPCETPVRTTPERSALPSSSAAGSSRPTHSVIKYLKSWQPPLAYYARRRHHPSLAHPSRRPSLPALLEERATPEGNFYLVRPEHVISHNRRSPCMCLSCKLQLNSQGRPAWSHCAQRTVRGPRTPAFEGWDEQSDEDIREDQSDEDEDDDDYWSEPESVEAVTPISSPNSPSPFFLQPLFLTKPPGC